MLALGEVFAEAVSVRFIQLFLRRTRAQRVKHREVACYEYNKVQPVNAVALSLHDDEGDTGVRSIFLFTLAYLVSVHS
jgi:hypothetical protein